MTQANYIRIKRMYYARTFKMKLRNRYIHVHVLH